MDEVAAGEAAGDEEDEGAEVGVEAPGEEGDVGGWVGVEGVEEEEEDWVGC